MKYTTRPTNTHSRQSMHSDLYHPSTTTISAGNMSNRHHLSPQMLLQTCNPSLQLQSDRYGYDDLVTTDSPLPARSFSSSTSASINHKEAEKRRRERINSHLNRLRTLLPCNSKTDKASLLAKVIQRLKELKQTTSEIEHLEGLPSETDEITVISLNNNQSDGRIVIKASICCDDRSDLLSDMIRTLKSLHLSPSRMELVAMGGRIRNVVLVECDYPGDDCGDLIHCLKEALGCLIKSNLGSDQSSKRRKMLVCT
ncbi:putative transcription factor bHLH107 [Lactuca sativa]|uniref:putative transcription factor bHLH107 n=1 Tax=Lactuca sativa TaxID=4236 RepID=UPI000CC129E1|nr:putative transcription factor bHLH107 [Lactuca sativa]